MRKEEKEEMEEEWKNEKTEKGEEERSIRKYFLKIPIVFLFITF
jgi:hypothetical protein